MVRSEKPQRRERASCRRRRHQPIHHVRKNKIQLVFLDVCEFGPQLSDFSGFASQGVAALLLILSCWSATMLIAKVTQGGDLVPDSLCLGRRAAEGNDAGSTPRAPAPVLSKSKEHKQPRCDHGPAMKPRPPANSKEAQADRLTRIEPKQSRNRLSTAIHKTNRHEGNKSVARRRLCLAAGNMTEMNPVHMWSTCL